ncbi:MAG: adenylate/guanylate cyclase domain-containing protein [Actinomycetota bacterium]
MPPRTQYAKHGDLNIAYQVKGEGPIDILVVPSFVSNIEFWWAHPVMKAWWDRVTSFARLILFDKLGTGCSDPVSGPRTLEQRSDEIKAVMEAVGCERPVLFGLSEGGPSSIVFAATHPGQVQALVLFGTFASVGLVDASPDEIRAELAKEGVAERYWPTDAQLERIAAFRQRILDSWGDGEALALLVPNMGDAQQQATAERLCASPGMARATMESAAMIDIRDVLPTINVPTLVVHADEDLVPIQSGRYIADHIPGARFLEVKGRDHAPWLTEPDLIAGEIEEFLTGVRHVREPDRVLATVLFTDIVGSTERAAELGDARWRAVLERHGEVTRSELARFGGREVKSTGDGFLASFDGPARAIRCAEAIRGAVRGLGMEIRAGIHTGECEVMGDDVGGIAIHIAARVNAVAVPGEILVSRTVRDLVVGSGIAFEERGSQTLKGVPGEWSLLAVVPEGAAQESPEVKITKIETPSPRESMRRLDRIAAAVARRAPGVLRTASRLETRRRARQAT